MTRVFADSFYFLALLNTRDQYHAKATAFSNQHDQALVTTVWVLTEVADAVSRSSKRQVFKLLLARMRGDPDCEVVSADQDTWDRAVDLYSRRADKQWSLTDCISFEIMREKGLTDALTGDHHFEQAGFTILLK